MTLPFRLCASCFVASAAASGRIWCVRRGPRRKESAMCNLYSYTRGQAAIRELARAFHDRTGNMPPLPGIFPDYSAPIVCNGPDGRELAMARWGMPSPQNVLMEATKKRAQKL